MYKLCIFRPVDGEFRKLIKAAMLERGVRQQELARQCRLSQGHLSKVLKSLPMGQRTRSRLQKWLDSPDEVEREGVLDAAELRHLGVVLKRHCEALAAASQHLGSQHPPSGAPTQ